MLTTNAEIKKFHARFFNDPTVTDVITFADDTSRRRGVQRRGVQRRGAAPPTIDVVISLDQATLQARRRGIPLCDEVALLICHALLHAKGFDDLTEKEALIMRQKEFETMMRVLSGHKTGPATKLDTNPVF